MSTRLWGNQWVVLLSVTQTKRTAMDSFYLCQIKYGVQPHQCSPAVVKEETNTGIARARNPDVFPAADLDPSVAFNDPPSGQTRSRDTCNERLNLGLVLRPGFDGRRGSSSMMHGALSADRDASGQLSEASPWGRAIHGRVRALVRRTAVCVSALSCQIDDVMLKPPDRKCVCSPSSN